MLATLVVTLVDVKQAERHATVLRGKVLSLACQMNILRTFQKSRKIRLVVRHVKLGNLSWTCHCKPLHRFQEDSLYQLGFDGAIVVSLLVTISSCRNGAS